MPKAPALEELTKIESTLRKKIEEQEEKSFLKEDYVESSEDEINIQRSQHRIQAAEPTPFPYLGINRLLQLEEPRQPGDKRLRTRAELNRLSGR